jgi:recombination protein U
MPKAPGKQFEDDWKKSVPPETFFERLKDSSASWQGGDQARFTPTNMCDHFMYDQNKNFYLIELKSTKAKSVPYGDALKVINGSKEKGLKCGNFKANQIKGLFRASGTNRLIVAGFVINFRELNETYYIPIDEFMHYILDNEKKKSIPIKFFQENCYQVPQEQKRIHWRYNIEEFQRQVEERNNEF